MKSDNSKCRMTGRFFRCRTIGSLLAFTLTLCCFAAGAAAVPDARRSEGGFVRPGDRILLMGDSITEQGVCVAGTGQYHQLTNLAARADGELNLEFVNLGFSGSTLADWEAWERRSRTEDVWQYKHVPGRRRNLREEFAKGAGVLVLFIGQNDITHPLMTDAPASQDAWVGRVERLLDTLQARTGAHGVVLGTITACGTDPESARNRGRRAINARLADLARRRGWRVADYGPTIDGLQKEVARGWRFNLVGDYVHPAFRKLGHTALALELCRALGLSRMAERCEERLRREIFEHTYEEKSRLYANMTVDPDRSVDKASFTWTFVWRWTDARSTAASHRRVPDVSVRLPEGFRIVSATDFHAAQGTVRIEGRPERLSQKIAFVARHEGGADTYDVPIHAPWRVVAGLDGSDRWGPDGYRADAAPSSVDQGVADGSLIGAPLRVDGKSHPWEVFLSSPSYCGFWHPGNLNAEQFTFGTQTDAFYAVRRIRAARGRAVTGAFSHDTWWAVLGARVWLNGQEVFAGAVGKEGPSCSLPFKAGENLLVIRADHNRGQRQFSFDLKPTEADDLSDLRFDWR